MFVFILERLCLWVFEIAAVPFTHQPRRERNGQGKELLAGLLL
jgi:hypothetical protein